jgi:hypothetical protein
MEIDGIGNKFVMVIALLVLPAAVSAQAPDTVWTRIYQVPYYSDDHAWGCTVDGSGGACVTGYTTNGILSIKYTAAGDTVWTRRYDGASNSFGCMTDGSNNIYVVGFSFADHGDWLVIKYNPSGDTLWTRKYHDSEISSGSAHACAVDDSDNLIVTGYTYDSISFYGCLTMKYSPSGDSIWARKYYSASGCWAFGCAADSANNVYVVGEDWTSAEFLIIKYSASGDTLWTRRFNASIDVDRARGCAVDGSGDVFVTGHCGDDPTNTDYMTIKYNSSGDTVWTRRYNGPANHQDYAYGCVVDGMGNLYVTGSSCDETNDENFLTIKYNASGDTIWTRRDVGPFSDQAIATGCDIDSLGMLYVTGYAYNSGTGNYQYMTVKYGATTGVAEKTVLPFTQRNLWLGQNRPNPFKGQTIISYQLLTSGTASLKIYDAIGQLVKTFILGTQPAGCHQVEWRDSRIAAGVYFYRLTQGDSHVTKRLVVVK